MKITVEIGPSRLTQFLGAQAQRVKTGSGRARNSVKSGFSRVQAAGRALVTKPTSPVEPKVVS